ncbi:hypothetical protein [Bradyrhizobium sp. I71]|uniref:hypothetical protein n=1 Tax=Bradyrhizobium sp. I71 TaxID=2590772 RepID=UPI001EF8DFFB|nr:hypothetical protein [Bradyrhizobium sp. I71]ULK95924.1 hypothetical protein FJV43_24580 [Bradyrhizobium sp. I71]
MRLCLSVSIAIFSIVEAAAQDKLPQDRTRPPEGGQCSYTVAGKQYEVAVGSKICFRSPPPYGDQYSLQQCFPPLDEIALVKRGDPRCDRYEDRQ